MPNPIICNNCGNQFSGLVPVFSCYVCQSDDISSGDLIASAIRQLPHTDPSAIVEPLIESESPNSAPVNTTKNDKFCTKCGNEISAGDIYCGQCGVPLKGAPGRKPTSNENTPQRGMGRWLWPIGFALGFYTVSVFAQAISDTAFGIMRIGEYNVWIVIQIIALIFGLYFGIDFNRKQ